MSKRPAYDAAKSVEDGALLCRALIAADNTASARRLFHQIEKRMNTLRGALGIVEGPRLP